jgi:hypothetical protein
MDYDGWHYFYGFLAILTLFLSMQTLSHHLIKFVFTCLLFTFCKFSLAQNQTNPHYGYRVNALYGYHYAPNVVNKTNMSLNGYVSGIELSILKYGLKKEAFNQIYGKPKLAVNLKLFQMNKPDTFGQSLGIIPTFDLPVISYKKLLLSARFGYGLNLNNVQYHNQNNFDNRAISSAINFGFDLGGNLTYTFNKYLEMELNAGLYHVSNGSLKMPNGGLNIVYGSAGICYFPLGSNKSLKPHTNYADSTHKWHLQAQLAAGYRELSYFNNVTQFWVASASLNYLYSVNKLYSIGLGLDGFYDATQGLLVNDKLRVRDIKENEKYHLALGIYQRFDVGKLFLPVGIYHYVLPLKNIQEPVYIRFGLGYQFHKNIYTGLFFKGTINNKLKLQSDFMEWTIGVRI